jgi:transcriptional regulator with XRE-family HTH domain
VRELRHQRGISINQLADASQESKGHLSSFERGLVNVTVGTLFKLARGLETTPMHIMCAAGDSKLERSVEELHALPLRKQRKLAAKLFGT